MSTFPTLFLWEAIMLLGFFFFTYWRCSWPESDTFESSQMSLIFYSVRSSFTTHLSEHSHLCLCIFWHVLFLFLVGQHSALQVIVGLIVTWFGGSGLELQTIWIEQFTVWFTIICEKENDQFETVRCRRKLKNQMLTKGQNRKAKGLPINFSVSHISMFNRTNCCNLKGEGVLSLLKKENHRREASHFSPPLSFS